MEGLKARRDWEKGDHERLLGLLGLGLRRGRLCVSHKNKMSPWFCCVEIVREEIALDDDGIWKWAKQVRFNLTWAREGSSRRGARGMRGKRAVDVFTGEPVLSSGRQRTKHALVLSSPGLRLLSVATFI